MMTKPAIWYKEDLACGTPDEIIVRHEDPSVGKVTRPSLVRAGVPRAHSCGKAGCLSGETA